MIPSRRGLFGFLAGALATPVFAKLPFVGPVVRAAKTATSTATISGGVITEITINNPGAGYAGLPAFSGRALVSKEVADDYMADPYLAAAMRSQVFKLPQDHPLPIKFDWNGYYGPFSGLPRTDDHEEDE